MKKNTISIPTTKHERCLEALKVLESLGAVFFISNTELYHGRTRKKSDTTEWKVKVDLDNGGKFQDHVNADKRAGLYVGSMATAKAYAEKRAREFNDGGSMVFMSDEYRKKLYESLGDNINIGEILEIESLDENAVLFNEKFDCKKLSSTDLKLYYDALKTLCDFKITEYAPIKLEYRRALPIITKYIIEEGIIYFDDNDIENLITKLIKDQEIRDIFVKPENLREFICDYISAGNTRNLSSKILPELIQSFEKLDKYVVYSNKKIPINQSYLSSLLSNNHIIGKYWTPTNDLMAHVFDNKKIAEKKQHGDMLQNMMQSYDRYMLSDLEKITSKELGSFLKKANAEEILQFIQKEEHCNNLYNKSAYINEGWTVGEHTGAVLRFFDDYYSNDVPDEIKPLLKLAILTHDLGKGEERENWLKKDTSTLQNSKYLYDFFEVPYEYRSLIDFIATKAQEHTTSIAIHRRKSFQEEYAEFAKSCREAYIKTFNSAPSNKDIHTIMNAAIVLQSCDSGAYTTYARILEEDKEGSRYVKGGNLRFTSSFKLNERGNPRLQVFEEHPPEKY